MSAVTPLIQGASAGDPQAAEELLPLVYEELHRLAAQKMAGEIRGHTLQPTALVHEAWLRLAGDEAARFENRAHFFWCGGGGHAAHPDGPRAPAISTFSQMSETSSLTSLAWRVGADSVSTLWRATSAHWISSRQISVHTTGPKRRSQRRPRSGTIQRSRKKSLPKSVHWAT